MRGGQPARIVLMTLEAQFSPHVRGSTHETDTVNSDGMIHPACAGVTLFIDWPFDGVSIHPACAGVNSPTDRLLCSYAHSPRMRGDQPR